MSGRLLHHWVDEAAARAPNVPAFRMRDDEITYERLARKSDQLAALLIEGGVRPGDRVGLYLNKSLETPVALFGVLKAGAAYAPLDPTAPMSRTAAVMRECGVRALITHEPKARAAETLLSTENLGDDFALVIGAAAPPAASLRAISWSALDAAPSLDEPDRTEDDIAYIIFTSGSTGAPKGITHTHRSGVAYALAAAELYEVSPDSRLSNHSPLHFDMSTFDYLSGPCAGACTVIIPEAYAMLPASMSTLIEQERFTHWYSVPFALIQLLEHGALDQRDLASLRWVMFGGEPFPAKYLRALRAHMPNATFSNVYGPAEVNQCTYHHVLQEDFAAETPPPIGKTWAIADGIQLDEHDAIMNTGSIGELAIASDTMMEGYWGRGDLNAKAFYTRIGDDGAKTKYYRTGDIVRDLGDGIYEFVGRKDRQTKVRGYRVELEEVESVISAVAGVSEAAAVIIEGASGSAEIASSFTAQMDDGDDLINRIQSAVAEKLPVYAAPAHLERIASFPRTTSGKIDRNAVARQFSIAKSEEAIAHAG
ncbi:MAG: amino acid adenylation domain-containing protein [Pseudomonadota bacterium]